MAGGDEEGKPFQGCGTGQDVDEGDLNRGKAAVPAQDLHLEREVGGQPAPVLRISTVLLPSK